MTEELPVDGDKKVSVKKTFVIDTNVLLHDPRAMFSFEDNDVVIRSKIWVKKGKRNKYLEVQELEEIEGVWVPTVMTLNRLCPNCALIRA